MGKVWKYIMIVILLAITPGLAKAETYSEYDVNMAKIKLKILTLNIHGGIDWNGHYNLDAIAAFIKKVDPDIIGLQEVDRVWSQRSGFQDLCAELALRLKMNFAFSASLQRNQGHYGNQIISKHPMVYAWAEQMPSIGEQRSFVFAQLLIEGVRVNVLNTHLGLSPEERQLQVGRILKFLNQIDGPLIITGDFNEDREDGAVALMLNEFLDLQSQTGQPPQGTLRLKDGTVNGRIDYIFTSPEFSVNRFEVIDNYLSDHLPVMAEVDLRIDPVKVSGEPVFLPRISF